jgi:N-dimethylarginine dimethylaminohydrolase
VTAVSATTTEVARLTHVAIKHVRDAWVDDATLEAQWQALGFTAKPDLPRAVEEHDRLVDILRSAGAEVHLLPADHRTTLDSIYARDASIVTPRGLILCTMGKRLRGEEPAAQERALRRLAVLPILGRIDPPGTLEGGDVVWFDDTTVAVGRGYRTNAEGIRQLRALVGHGIRVVEVALPHWRGAQDVMHLMSLISPVDDNAAVVYSPLMPVTFREWLLERGMELIEVPEAEFETMGANVLALAPRRCLMLTGNPRTRAALERAGAEVIEYEGAEISVKGAGGPTCLTRPLVRLGGSPSASART